MLKAILILSLLLFIIRDGHVLQSNSISLLDGLPSCQFTNKVNIDGLRVGAVLLNMETGQGCVENLDTAFPIASIPKVFIVGAFLEKVAQNEASFQAVVRFTDNYLMGDSNACLTENRIGETITLGYLSDIMISCSDNAATWILMDVLGWQTVQGYINRLGIDGIGPVIPYSEVDRLKLAILDERWAHVPRTLAAQFYRRRRTDQLVPAFFDEIPRYTRAELAAANAKYLAQYDYNTATPRAVAEYLLKLRDDLEQPGTTQAQIAWWLFNTMLLTQRQYSVQAAPGTLFVGAKNGSDYGIWAEVNVLYSSLETRIPQAMIIVFLQQTDFDDSDLQLPWYREGILNTLLRSLSPQILARIYPEYERPDTGSISGEPFIVFSNRAFIENCWDWYVVSNFEALDRLASCWRALQEVNQLSVGEELGFGLILYDLNQQDTRLSFIYTEPNGEQFSYQSSVLSQEDAPAYWFRELDAIGTWRIDIYQDLHHIYSWLVFAEA
ncbi:MAG: hypothetical protein CL610_15670 [Anaerolineaceae bacterium]|nr:hypothetical protein [Anaerolineaceae bacterium]